jgi:hypothetical protein
MLKGCGDIQSQIQLYFNDSADSSASLDNVIGTLSLKSIEIEDKKLTSLGTLSMLLHFQAIDNDILQSLVLLINNTLGQRIAIIDLRPQIAFAKIVKGQSIKVNIKIRSIPLLQGDYEIGLFYHGEKGMVNSYNLKTVNILSQPSTGDLIPYDLSVRGLVELDSESEIVLS